MLVVVLCVNGAFATGHGGLTPTGCMIRFIKEVFDADGGPTGLNRPAVLRAVASYLECDRDPDRNFGLVPVDGDPPVGQMSPDELEKPKTLRIPSSELREGRGPTGNP